METIGKLVTDVMWTLTKNYPSLESTPFGVNELIIKFSVKNFVLAEHLRTRQQQDQLAEDYHSLQKEAEAFMLRRASIGKSADAAKGFSVDNRQNQSQAQGNFYRGGFAQRSNF